MQFLTGAVSSVLYGFRFPEAFFPGKCDVFFHSHQIFHVFCSMSTIYQMWGKTKISFGHFSTTDYVKGRWKPHQIHLSFATTRRHGRFSLLQGSATPWPIRIHLQMEFGIVLYWSSLVKITVTRKKNCNLQFERHMFDCSWFLNHLEKQKGRNRGQGNIVIIITFHFMIICRCAIVIRCCQKRVYCFKPEQLHNMLLHVPRVTCSKKGTFSPQSKACLDVWMHVWTELRVTYMQQSDIPIKDQI